MMWPTDYSGYDILASLDKCWKLWSELKIKLIFIFAQLLEDLICLMGNEHKKNLQLMLMMLNKVCQIVTY